MAYDKNANRKRPNHLPIMLSDEEKRELRKIGRAVQQECRDRSLACISYAVFCLKKKKRLAEGVGKLVMIQDHPQ